MTGCSRMSRTCPGSSNGSNQRTVPSTWRKPRSWVRTGAETISVRMAAASAPATNAISGQETLARQRAGNTIAEETAIAARAMTTSIGGFAGRPK